MPRRSSPGAKTYKKHTLPKPMLPKAPGPYAALAKKSVNRVGTEGPKKSMPAKKAAAKKTGTKKGR